MALDFFIKLGSSNLIKGESRDKVHADEVDVLSYNIGATNPGTGGGTGGAARTEFHDFTFVMYTDKATPKLLEYLATGKHLDQALLTVRKAGTTQIEYIKWTFTDVVFTGLGQGASGAEDRVTQEVSFGYQKIKIDYQETTLDGKAGGSSSYQFDIAANKTV